MTTAMSPDPNNLDTSVAVEGQARRAVAQLVADAQAEPALFHAPAIAAAQRAITERAFRRALAQVDAARRVAASRRAR